MVNKTKTINFAYFFVCIITFLFVYKSGYILYPDSYGYMEVVLIRSFGYPLFLSMHKIVFGINYLYYVVFTQLIFILIGVFFLLKTIKNYLFSNSLYLFFLFLVLIMPVFFQNKVANSILSEGLSYAFYLLFLSVFFNLILAKSQTYKQYFWAAFILFLLINIRGQFLFLIPLLLFVVLLKQYQKKLAFKNVLIALLLVISVPILSILSDKTYHKIQHNHFTSTPWTGIQLAAVPMFVSQEKDSILFKNDLEKKYFLYIYKQLEKEKVLKSQLQTGTYDFTFYYDNFGVICNETLSNYGGTFFKNESIDQRVIKNDKITFAITFPLLKAHFVDWFSLLFKNMYVNFFSISFLVTFIVLFGIALFGFIQTKSNINLLLLIFSLLILLNLLLVAIVEPIIDRYIFYNHWIFLVIIVYLLEKKSVKI